MDAGGELRPPRTDRCRQNVEFHAGAEGRAVQDKLPCAQRPDLRGLLEACPLEPGLALEAAQTNTASPWKLARSNRASP
jgi:hypothetical protein